MCAPKICNLYIKFGAPTFHLNMHHTYSWVVKRKHCCSSNYHFFKIHRIPTNSFGLYVVVSIELETVLGNTKSKSSSKVLLMDLTPIWGLFDSRLALTASLDCSTGLFVYKLQTSRVTRWQCVCMSPRSPRWQGGNVSVCPQGHLGDKVAMCLYVPKVT